MRMNAPRICGSFAVWDGLFSSFDCAMVYLRQKEGHWNLIIAGVATGGFLQTHQGFDAASRSTAFGGVLLALIEGDGITLNMPSCALVNSAKSVSACKTSEHDWHPSRMHVVHTHTHEYKARKQKSKWQVIVVFDIKLSG
ncbi:hypothetical protein POM88_018084 [Heracleum sosnowskyi]|uniref:Uncharacterized protein n=1 Tax=Heracleum sosnowskyi TaxID=360622 RepID=A0AAD8IS53_9APIA|nr:hypothetical protein POM88_018084 [Heracleum sosnowskyi]